MSSLALKWAESEWDFQKQRNLPFHLPWVHVEADILKMVPWLQQSVWGLDHDIINTIAFLRNGLTIKLTIRRPSTSVHYLALMSLSFWDKITILSALLTPEEKEDIVPILLCVPPTPWTLVCLTDTSSLPSDRLCGHAKSCSIQLAIWPCWVLPAWKDAPQLCKRHGQRLSMWAGGKHSLEATVSRQ